MKGDLKVLDNVVDDNLDSKKNKIVKDGEFQDYVDTDVLKPIETTRNNMVERVRKLVNQIPKGVASILNYIFGKIRSLGSYILNAPLKFIKLFKKAIEKLIIPIMNKIRKMFGMEPLEFEDYANNTEHNDEVTKDKAENNGV